MRVLSFALFLLLTLIATAQVASATENRIVIRVVSGDTFIIDGGQAVRLIGVVAPASDQFYAKESQQALTELLLGQEVELEFDNKNAAIGNKDSAGRRLSYVRRAADNAFINQLMIVQGYCFFTDNYVQKFKPQLLTDQQTARKDHRGVWQQTDRSPQEQLQSVGLPYKEPEFQLKAEYKTPDLLVEILWAKKADPRFRVARSADEAEFLRKIYQDAQVGDGKLPPLVLLRKNLAEELTKQYQEKKIQLRVETSGNAAEVLRFVAEGMDQKDADNFCAVKFNRELFAGLEFTEVIFTDDDKFSYTYKVE